MIATGTYTVDGATYVVEPATRGVRVLGLTPKGRTYHIGGIRHDGTTYTTTTKPAIADAIAQLASAADDHLVTATHHCTVCHRELTDPTSIAKGIGPECAAKVA